MNHYKVTGKFFLYPVIMVEAESPEQANQKMLRCMTGATVKYDMDSSDEFIDEEVDTLEVDSVEEV